MAGLVPAIHVFIYRLSHLAAYIWMQSQSLHDIMQAELRTAASNQDSQMNDFDEEIPFGLSKEQWADMLAEAEKRDAANRRRSETMKAKAAAKKAERLSRPPIDLDDAWQRHAASCPHPAFSKQASEWFRKNRSFDFDGAMWRRERTFQKTNSGKGERLRSITYYSNDGRVVTTCDEGPNRRNDERRNWGLPE